jgi:hypothetical protein
MEQTGMSHFFVRVSARLTYRQARVLTLVNGCTRCSMRAALVVPRSTRFPSPIASACCSHRRKFACLPLSRDVALLRATVHLTGSRRDVGGDLLAQAPRPHPCHASALAYPHTGGG